MSSPAAIAAVTASIQGVVRDALDKAGGVLPSKTAVIALSPDLIPLGTNVDPRLNVFLYEVSPNTGWSNERLAARDPGGNQVANPYLALDLSYLLTAYGVSDLQAELLLGYAMNALHETPGVSRGRIREVLADQPGGAPNPLPADFREAALDLADQIESIKISPRYLKMEDMSKIWTSLQCHYRPSMAYQVTVVLIEPKRSSDSAPPVLRIGPFDRGPVVQPNLLPPFPTLLVARAPDKQPAAPSTAKVELFGHHLDGTEHQVLFRHPRLDAAIKLEGDALSITKPNLTPKQVEESEDLRFADARIEADLSKANPWLAGVYGVSVQLTPHGAGETRATNTLSLAIAPSFRTAVGPEAPVVARNGNHLSITLTTAPKIGKGQAASLMIGSLEIPISDISADTDKPVFKGVLPPGMRDNGAAGKNYLARLRVDGVESLYIRRFDKPRPPEFDPSQQIKVP